MISSSTSRTSSSWKMKYLMVREILICLRSQTKHPKQDEQIITKLLKIWKNESSDHKLQKTRIKSNSRITRASNISNRQWTGGPNLGILPGDWGTRGVLSCTYPDAVSLYKYGVRRLKIYRDITEKGENITEKYKARTFLSPSARNPPMTMQDWDLEQIKPACSRCRQLYINKISL